MDGCATYGRGNNVKNWHDYEVSWKDGVEGFLCRGCGAWFRHHSTRPIDGCSVKSTHYDFCTPEFIKGLVERFKDNDSLRPEVAERAKQELGFGLMGPYNNTEDR
jgi:hypothetical protein